ncbi:hypothetical protein Taro_032317 [Colocasia esculenta]|uniref:Secreted protein n=1 Tax=Colocasia esculenta TaxID=4460 RepID=A0A843VSD9_COLES|nr:hypothetical protein [Colocasia esculenta]
MVAVFARAAVVFILSLHVRVGVSRRLREPTCGVAFTGAGLLPVDPVEGSCLVGCSLVVGSTSLLELSRCFVCCVVPLVKRCDTCLWLLSALCRLVVNSSEVLPEFFSVGSGGGENGTLVVLVEVLPEPVCVASAICCVLSVGRLFGLRSGDVFPERLLALSVEVLPKLPCVCFVFHCSLSVEMSCRHVTVGLGVVGQGVVPLTLCLAVVLARLSS